MSDIPKLLGISGSLRAGSRNTALIHECARAFGPCDFRVGDIRLPLFDEDLETAEGIPASVRALDDLVLWSDAVVFSCPEYNKALPGSLKNALDWLSRTKTKALSGKPVAIVSAASGRAGGERTQLTLRLCLGAFDPRVIPVPEVMIAGAGKAFDTDGRLIDEKSFAFLQTLMGKLNAEIQLTSDERS